VPLVSRQTLLNNKVDLRSSDFVVSQVMTQEAAAPQRGKLLMHAPTPIDRSIQQPEKKKQSD
jgi:hypothetical protein